MLRIRRDRQNHTELLRIDRPDFAVHEDRIGGEVGRLNGMARAAKQQRDNKSQVREFHVAFFVSVTVRRT